MFYEVKNGHPLLHNPIYACVVPRPIGWISSVDEKGTHNLAPYSFFNAVSVDPPMIMFCPCGFHAEGGEKDSGINAIDRGEFVYSMATYEMKDAMNLSSISAPRDQDEFEIAGVEKADSILIDPPRVKSSPISFECKTWKVIDLPLAKNGSKNTIVIGSVIGVHIDDSCLVDGKIDLLKIRPISRLGYKDYAVIDELFSLQRPD